MHGNGGPLETGGQQPKETAVPEPTEHAVPSAPRRKSRAEFVRELEEEAGGERVKFRPSPEDR